MCCLWKFKAILSSFFSHSPISWSLFSLKWFLDLAILILIFSLLKLAPSISFVMHFVLSNFWELGLTFSLSQNKIRWSLDLSYIDIRIQFGLCIYDSPGDIVYVLKLNL